MQPYYVIPLLIEQPTWGGKYIADFKQIAELEVTQKNVGQAFELFDQSYVTQNWQWPMSSAFATPATLKEPKFFQAATDALPIQQVIDQDPEGFLGSSALQQYGPAMKVLIKFTQAQNNSYQVHVRPDQEFAQWQAKPESWYFFEPGKATLGLKAGASAAEYQARCQAIDTFAQSLSQQVLAGSLTVATAREQLREFIIQDHPQRFVNTVMIGKNQVIDLSGGGIHHSWEMDAALPDGNIVYEVQKDVKDEFCTLRSFDQGNIKDDGKVRPLTIDQYFQALNTSADDNHPETYLRTPAARQDGVTQVTELFANQFYHTSLIEFSGEYQGTETQTSTSFHHLFVQQGEVEVLVDGKIWPLKKGWSMVLPAKTGSYALQAKESTKVLKTWV